MRLNTNLNSLNIYRNEKTHRVDSANALNRITSGKKLLNSKDNPNKIGQSGELRIKIKSLQMAEKNLQDANSMLQATEGALTEVSNQLIRIRELTVIGTSDTKSKEDKEIIQKEIDSIKDGIEEIIYSSDFNGQTLIGNREVIDNNYPDKVKVMGGSQVGEQIEIPKFNLGVNFIEDRNGVTLREVNILEEGADKFITTVDDSIAFVGNVRSNYGAIQKRVESSSEYISSVNLSNEKTLSSIEDTDIALEIMEYSKADILTNAGMALMVQSNNLPKEILGILERVGK